MQDNLPRLHTAGLPEDARAHLLVETIPGRAASGVEDGERHAVISAFRNATSAL